MLLGPLKAAGFLFNHTFLFLMTCVQLVLHVKAWVCIEVTVFPVSFSNFNCPEPMKAPLFITVMLLDLNSRMLKLDKSLKAPDWIAVILLFMILISVQCCRFENVFLSMSMTVLSKMLTTRVSGGILGICREPCIENVRVTSSNVL